MQKYKLTHRLDLGLLATFMPNKGLPVYNWYYYKEGFSRDIVFLIADMFNLKAGDTVLDPFCGVGTTLLACKEKGINAIGTDVSEVAFLASKVKARNYNAAKLRGEMQALFRIKFVRPEIKIDSGVVRRSFSKYALEDIIFFRDNIVKINDENMRDFFLLALMSSAMDVSFAKKTGASIRVEKRSAPPLKFLLKRRLKRMIKDVEKSKPSVSKIDVFFSSATSLDIKDNSIDAIVTSPPYLAKMEYAKIYPIEQVLFFGGTGRPKIKSFIGENESAEDVFFGKYDLPKEALGYFFDMNRAISEIYRVLKIGGKAAIIVGEGCFPGGVVQSDILLAELAKKCGFKVKQILVLNERWCMKDRTIKVGKLRESMVVLEKD